MDEPDPPLVDAARHGDLRAFERLVVAYQADVWRLAWHLVHDATMADDVTQEAFIRAYRFLPGYRGEAKFSTWLFSVTRTCAVDELRRAGRYRKITDTIEAQPLRAASDYTIAVEVREALAALPLELREPIVLIDMFGVSYGEVARMLKVREGTIKSRVHRGRELLAAALAAPATKDAHES